MVRYGQHLGTIQMIDIERTPRVSGAHKQGRLPQNHKPKSEKHTTIVHQQLPPQNPHIRFMPALPQQVYEQPMPKSSTELARVKAVWPFDLFPNELIIEEERIVLVENYFFFNHVVTTIMVDNLVSCGVSSAMLFAKLTMQDKFGDILALDWLTRDMATLAKELIDGLMMKDKSLQALSEDDILFRLKLLRELGQTRLTN